MPGHESYVGRLAVPYLTRSGVVSIRFRFLPQKVGDDWPDTEGAKYLGLPGDTLRPFNVNALMRTEPYICITEGEFDAISAHQAGLPAVGFPGVASLKEPYYLRPFKGYEAVYILADNDDKGQGGTFAEKIAENVQNARVILMPKGHDVNSFLKAEGPEALKERIGLK